jgi:polyhydroxybutyrate depolymerase
MKKILLLLAFTASSALLSQSALNTYDSILSGNLQRKFRLYVPAIYNSNTPTPLIINMHGYGSNATQQAGYSNFYPIADTAGFIMVYPEGTFSNGLQYWNAGFGGTVNDVLFISNLIDSLKLIYNIDLDRVYSCGMSNGGIMSYYLSIYLSNRIAAIASVTGSMLNSWFSGTPNPPRPFPVMQIHGTSDATVPYNGDGTFTHVDSMVKKWRVYNNCNSTPVTTSVPNISTIDNSTATHYFYPNGSNGSTVELYKVQNGSHSWPGAYPFIANTNQDFKASVEIWRFFRQYTISQFFNTQSIKENVSGNYFSVYPNPAKDFIQIETGELCLKEVSIYDFSGKLILTATSNRLELTGFQRGLYLLIVETEKGRSAKKLLIEE